MSFMSKAFLASVAILMTLHGTTASAEPVDTRVSRFLEPRGPDDMAIALLSAYGRALRLPQSETDPRHLRILKEAARSGQGLRIEFTDQGAYDTIESITPSDNAESFEIDPSAFSGEPPPSRPDTSLRVFDGMMDGVPNGGHSYEEDSRTTLTAVEDSASLFHHLRSKGLLRGSQCFQRAHLWAHDMWTEQRIPSQKVFLFFTPKYVRNYGYKWWFHVSPFVVADGQEIVLDATFTSRPLPMKEWTDVFMAPDPYCPTVPKYFGWYNHHQDKDCYLRKVPMYYYHPDSMQITDRAEKMITEWDESTLHRASVARPWYRNRD